MKHRVIIRRCPSYDVEAIARIIAEGMAELGYHPRGKTLFKPNTVLAQREVFPHAFTRAEFLEGAVLAAQRRAAEPGAPRVSEFSVGERCGITVPTRYCFGQAGYNQVIKRHGLKAYYFDEARHLPVDLNRPENLRRKIMIPKPIVEADSLINLPKFKAHPWTRLTLSLKNFIGLQDDRHRLVDHNTFLEHKIADLHDVIQPGFIAIDAITAGQKMMLTPTPFDLGAVVMGLNSCAVDTVGCLMVGVEPKDLIHLKMASERGLGPMDPDQIDISGDFPLDEIREKTKDFQFCLERVDDYFEDSPNLRCTVGSFPEAHSRDYCWGGCPGALQEAMHILRGFEPQTDEKMAPIHYVVGRVDQPLDVREGETVIFAGKCTAYSGPLNGKRVDIRSSYANRHHGLDRGKSNDMLLKTAQALVQGYQGRKSGYIHSPACPVSVAQHVTYLSALGRLPNPNFDSRMLLSINLAYLQMRLGRAWNRLAG